MCNPANSALIYKEQKKMLEGKTLLPRLIDASYFNASIDLNKWLENPSLWEGIYDWLKDVRQIYFTGGEPTLIKENWKILDFLIKEEYSKRIDLIFNLNCVIFPTSLQNLENTSPQLHFL